MYFNSYTGFSLDLLLSSWVLSSQYSLEENNWRDELSKNFLQTMRNYLVLLPHLGIRSCWITLTKRRGRAEACRFLCDLKGTEAIINSCTDLITNILGGLGRNLGAEAPLKRANCPQPCRVYAAFTPCRTYSSLKMTTRDVIFWAVHILGQGIMCFYSTAINA